MRRLLIAIGLVAAHAAAVATEPDREREARLRAEIVPNLVVGEAVDLRTADGAVFLGIYAPAASGAAPASSTAVVLVHGSGVHPDWGVIGRLRMDLTDRSFATLSIQMPVRPAGAPHAEYGVLMPVAAARIAAAATWLQRRGHADLALVSHSLGSRMADAYFASAPDAPFRVWASLGIVGGSYPPTLRQSRLRVVDIYGERDFDEVLAQTLARRAALPTVSQQVRIDGADHFYSGQEAELLKRLAPLLAR